eukprot:6200078-Pleurochrysis_carterae.AAC.3
MRNEQQIVPLESRPIIGIDSLKSMTTTVVTPWPFVKGELDFAIAYGCVHNIHDLISAIAFRVNQNVPRRPRPKQGSAKTTGSGTAERKAYDQYATDSSLILADWTWMCLLLVKIVGVTGT